MLESWKILTIVTFELKKPKLSEFKSSTEKQMKEPDILCKVELRGQKHDFMMPPKSPILELHGRVLNHLRLGSIFLLLPYSIICPISYLTYMI